MPESIAHPTVELGLEPDGHVVLDASPSGVAYVLINRPERKNAFDSLTIRALREAFETLQAADHVRIVFLRGAGGSFSAGADLEWMRAAAEASEDDNRADAMELALMLKALHDLPVLTVAMVEGAAFGGGVGLVAACDMAVATEDARFSLSEVRLGLTPATISPYVVRAVGVRNARRLFARAVAFDAAEALRIGLVDEVAPDAAALERRAEQLAEDAVWTAPGAVADAKRLADDVAGRALDHGLLAETARRIAERRASPEGREGVRAFLERRKAAWAGD
jgi:methylglutaconyl-CoA hydratase